MTSFKLVASAFAVSALALGVPATAATINLNNIGGVTAGSDVYKGFMAAASFWSSVLTNNVTINLDVGYSPLGTGILGQAGSNITTVSAVSAVAALRASATSALDMTAVAHLPTLSAAGGIKVNAPSAPIWNATTASYTTKKVADNDNSANNTALAITTANAKALGYSGFSGADASITFSSNFAFDFDPRNGIAANSYDFIGVATHEIGHALGFISGVDSYDLYTNKGPYASQGLNLNNYAIASTLDLFRYNRTNPATPLAATAAKPVLDWSPAGTAFLSVDGGYTPLDTGTGIAKLSTGLYNGNKRQASHWFDNTYGALKLGCQAPTATIGILDPTAGKCEQLSVTSLDLAALDLIGWTLGSSASNIGTARFTTSQIAGLSFGSATSAAVPEPASWAMLLFGFGGIGSVMRRRQAARTVTA
jgi:hypothetical protein